jgi:large subunit ribosomal protein L12
MEYIYAAMLLHKAGHKVTEAGVKKVLEAAGTHADDGRIKALVAALDGVNIDDAIKSAVLATAAPAAAPAHEEHKKEAKHEHKEEKKEEEAAAGLGALFG